MFEWICALTADCVACQNTNKHKPEHLNGVTLEDWQEAVPFRAIHIDHRGPLNPPSNRNTHFFLVVDSFSHFLMVYLVFDTSLQATIAVVEKWFLHFGTPQSIIQDRGTAFFNTDFVKWTKELRFIVQRRTALSP